MADVRRPLSMGEIRAYLADRCFTPDGPPRYGIELEWLPRRVTDLTRPADHATLVASLPAHLPSGGRLTLEPGGQVELSTAPAESLGDAVTAAFVDAATIRAAMDQIGVRLVGAGIDPGNLPARVVHSPRYEAMEAYFDGEGVCGRTMMRATASIQVNLPLGDGHTAAARWRLAHLLSPVLAATCANSPVQYGAPTGWVSSRLLTWAGIDPRRTTAPELTADPVDGWLDYVLAAPVILRAHEDGDCCAVPDARTFGDWVAGGFDDLPSRADLDVHLTTLFPPVRPRGWLELRVPDALPDPWWPVPMAVAVAVFDDADATSRLLPVLEGLERSGHAGEAARLGLAAPHVAAAATAVFAEGIAALPRIGATAGLVDLVASYADRWVFQARCPADDALLALPAQRDRR